MRPFVLATFVTVVCSLLGSVPRGHAEHHLQADTWTVADGLPQNTVTGLTQDRQGYLWVATRKGLARFDGQFFRPVGVVDGIDLSTLRLTAVAADEHGGVWVGTYAIGLLYLHEGRVERFGPDRGVPDGIVWDLRRDAAGRMWMAAAAGVRYLENGRWMAPAIPAHLSDAANTVHVDRAGRTWIGTSTLGAIRLDPTGAHAFAVDAGLPAARVFSIAEDQEGDIWAATPSGVVQFDEATERFRGVPGLQGVSAYQLLIDRTGVLWVATYGHGLLSYDPRRSPAVTRVDGPESDFILSLLEDRDGTVWAGTVSGGMTRLVPVARELLDARNGLPNFPVTTVYQARTGTVWIGTLGGGLASVRDGHVERLTSADGLPSDSITSVAGGPDDSLWIATSGAGVFRLEDGRVTQRLPPDVAGAVVRTVEAHGDVVYFGGRGVLRLTPDGTSRRWTAADGLGSDDVRVLYATDRGVYIGTYGGGLSLLLPDGTLRRWSQAEGLHNPFVTSVHVDATGTVWIGTYGGGVFRLQEGTIANISEAHGLEDNVVFDIMEDGQHRLWLMMNQGISVIGLADANKAADGDGSVLPGAFLGSAQGISGIDGTDGNQPQSWLTTDGRIWFATTHGVAIVDPAAVGNGRGSPAATIDSLEVDNVPVRWSSAGVSLDQRNVRFEYSTPQLLGASRVRYQHRLLGYDEGWSPPDDTRTVSFTNLPPGRYRFEVRAQASRGAPFGEVAAVTFDIQPRYYETRWFMATMIVLAGGLLSAAYIFRVRRLQHRERTLQQLVDSRTAALRHEMLERERADRERRALDERVQQAQRLESLGVLAGGIAHDFNNLLVGVLGEAGLAMLEVPQGSRARTHLQRIEQAALQASELTSQMLAYSGRGRFVQMPVDLAEIVRDTARLLTTLLGRQVTLDLAFPPDLPVVEGDPSQLRQVVMNLLTNASDAIGDRPGRIRVSAGTQVVDAAMADASSGDGDGPLAEGHYVWLRVQDDGAGMDAATLARIFEPFFSTKFTGRGLGLAAVQGIVRSHRGRIHVESTPGVGTTFSLLLPASAQRAARPPAEADAVPLPQRAAASANGATVLVVDDERTVRDVARAALEMAGFAVETAGDGEQALEIFRRAPQHVSLVLLDLTLPGMSGRRVFHELRAGRPGVPILLTSGFSEDEAADLVSQPRAGFVPKPWRPQELVAQVNRLIGILPPTP